MFSGNLIATTHFYPYGPTARTYWGLVGLALALSFVLMGALIARRRAPRTGAALAVLGGVLALTASWLSWNSFVVHYPIDVRWPSGMTLAPEATQRVYQFLQADDVQQEMSAQAGIANLWSKLARLELHEETQEIVLVGENLPYSLYDDLSFKNHIGGLVEAYALVGTAENLLRSSDPRFREHAAQLLHQARRYQADEPVPLDLLERRIADTFDQMILAETHPLLRDEITRLSQSSGKSYEYRNVAAPQRGLLKVKPL